MKKILVITLILLIIILIIILFCQYRKLSQAGFIPKISLFPKKEFKIVNLYFISPEADCLIPEIRRIRRQTTSVEQAKAVIKELVKGPQEEGLPSFPEGVYLRGLYIKEGIAYLDFSKELRDNHPGGTAAELLTIYSLVNTLTVNFPEIEKVQILMEGKEIDTLVGHIDTRRPFLPNNSLVKE